MRISELRWPAKVIVIAFVITAGIIWFGSMDPAKFDGKEVNATVSRGRTMITIRNTGHDDWQKVLVHINGAPPDGYWSAINLVAGSEDSWPLRDFAKDSGERFNPETQKVQSVVIGGSGYKYSSYSFKPN